MYINYVFFCVISLLSSALASLCTFLGTLQYADRAKQIKNKAVVNEDPTEKMIRGLKEELESLRKQLKQQETSQPAVQPTVVSGATEIEIQEMRAKFEKEREHEMIELREQMLENERQMKEQAKTWEERLKETELAAEEQVKQLSKAGISVQQGEDRAMLEEKKRITPHLFNLNEDPLMRYVPKICVTIIVAIIFVVIFFFT